MNDQDDQDVTWNADQAGTFHHAVIYDANPTIGEETTVTMIDADGNVDSHTFIAEDPDHG